MKTIREKCIYFIFSILTLRFGYDLKTRLTTFECLKDLDGYIARTYTFIYPTVFNSANHIFEKRLNVNEYITVIGLWIKSKRRQSPQLSHQQSLKFRELLVSLHLFT